MSLTMLIRPVAFAWLFSACMLAQSSSTAATPKPPTEPLPQSAVPQPPAQASDPLTQMRNDLNNLESLNMNMSSETEFLRDQNLQILLRTNSQMWTILIRDLRRQIEIEEQRRASSPPPQK